MISLVLHGWLVLAVGLALLWLWQLRTRNATSVDVAWSAGLAVLAVGYAIFAEGDVSRRALVGVLAAVWASRLALYLLIDRVFKASEEDGRYRAMRAHWGARAQPYFFLFYQGQALVAVLFSLPILAAMQGGPLDGWSILGAVLWLVAVGGETIADRQLAGFRTDPANRGQVCRVGLWRFSRHPNYFFEWVHWWTYVLVGRGAWLTWLGPVLMLLFLFRLTGIPFTEQQALRSRGDRYREYQRTTSVFIPWFPRKEAS
jgi:steroid 5-alpha reductase family enzyme